MFSREQLDLAVRRYLKLPFMNELSDRGRDVTIDELRGWKEKTLAACKRLLDSVDEDGKRFDEEQSAAYDEGLRMIEAWKRMIGELEENGQTVHRGGPRAGGRDPEHRNENGAIHGEGVVGRTAEGQLVRALGPNESFATYVREAGLVRERRFEGLGLGELVRAMVIGPRNDVERRALAEGSGAAGGFTVPVELLGEVIDKLRAQTHVIKAGAKTIPLNTFKTSVARILGDPGTPVWHAENAADFGVADPTFEAVTFQANTLASLLRLSRELVADSLNINDAVSNAVAQQMAVEIDRCALWGSGSGTQPKGLKTTTGVGSVSMGDNGAALTNYDPFIDAVQACLDANSIIPTAFIMAPRTFAKAAKLKDLQDNPLRKPELIATIPFLPTTSVPVNETRGSSNVASTIYCGDWSMCWIGIRAELQLDLLRELYAANYQFGLLASMRLDIQFAHPEAFAQIIGVL